ncbi:MAG: methyltransferase domain-containing protein [Chloroflexi bacterium]|nr:MAG: methyltransferase domain-containing protein [Chloroflexota bacterium]
MAQDIAKNLRDGVHQAYSEAAVKPDEKHPFPVGRAFAEQLGYPADLLDAMPPVAVEAFTGVSAVSLFAEIPAGVTVLDVGCGAGLDSLIAAQCVGEAGCVIGIDFSEMMLARARQAADDSGHPHLMFSQAAAEQLPLPDASVDVAMINGIFNLNPAREAIFHELARVMRPDGVMYVAETIIVEPLVTAEQTLDDWFS